MSKEQSLNHRQRLQDAELGVHLRYPTNPEVPTREIVQRMYRKERQLATPALTLEGYRTGAAEYQDEIYTSLGYGGLVLSTEHATAHWRTNSNTNTRDFKQAETGVAGLAATLAQDIAATHVSMLGRQTGDANNDPEHQLKDHLLGLADTSRVDTFVSVHAMMSGYVASLDDERCFDIVVGIGNEPDAQTVQLAQKIMAVAENHGLKAAINQPLAKIVEVDGQYYVQADHACDIQPVVFDGWSPGTTRRTVEDHAKNNGKRIAAVQIELAGTLRLMTPDVVRNDRAGVLGPYLGYATLLTSLGDTPHLL